jgi:hypothetical protein
MFPVLPPLQVFVYVCTLCLHAKEGCYVKLWTTLSSTS